jgi:hypothetical protein
VIHTRHKPHIMAYLVSYLILSLLFTVSVRLHIHVGDTAHHAAHGNAVAISALDDLTTTPDKLQGEIEVSLDKFFNKIKQNTAVALINTANPVVLAMHYFYCVTGIRDISACVVSLPFAGTPPLRAPPL